MEALYVVIAALVSTFSIGTFVGWMIRGSAETAKSDDSSNAEIRYDIRQPSDRHQWRNNSAKTPKAE